MPRNGDRAPVESVIECAGIRSWEDKLDNSKLPPERRADIDRRAKAELLAKSLREVRDLAGVTEPERMAAAERLQGQLPKIEGSEDELLSMLRRYVEALGGELEVVAVFGDKRIRLRGV